MSITPIHIIAAIEKDIAQFEQRAEQAMGKLERMNNTNEEFILASREADLYFFTAGYLNHIGYIARTNELKVTENAIRYHAYANRKKGLIGDGGDVDARNTAIATILEGYLDRFFEPQSQS